MTKNTVEDLQKLVQRFDPKSPFWHKETEPDEPSVVLDRLSRNGTWLDEQHFPPLEYAVPGIITEGMGLLVGPPKKGKSWFVGNIGLAVAAGGSPSE